MKYSRTRLMYFVACQLISVGFSPPLVSSQSDMTLQEKAFYISENNCEKARHVNTGPAVLFTGSHVTLVGRAKKIENTYGPNNERYSMTVTPQCIQKGDVSHDEIVVRNLGKTKCRRRNTEVGKNYLFFLRRTSDPKVYEAMSVGAIVVNGPFLWTPTLMVFCGLKGIKKCKSDACPLGCNYDQRDDDDDACIQLETFVTKLFSSLYPGGIPSSATRTIATTTVEPTATAEEKKITKKRTMDSNDASNPLFRPSLSNSTVHQTDSDASPTVTESPSADPTPETTSPHLLKLQMDVLKAQLTAATAIREAMVEVKAAALQHQTWVNDQLLRPLNSRSSD